MSGLLNLVKLHRWMALAVAVLLLAGGTGIVRLVRADSKMAAVEVRRGEFIDTLPIRGEVKAQKSLVLTAPSGAGDIQIVKLLKTGTQVKEGDVVVQFDVADQTDRYNTRLSELKQAESEIQNQRAKAHMIEEQDKTDFAKAKFDVERARLDAGKQEILSAIDGEKAKLKLADAEQSLHEAEQKLKADQQGNAADIASRQQKRSKAEFDVNQAKRNIEKMTLRAPLAGMVNVLTTWRGPGQQVEWREGDRAWPGAGIAELPDMNTIQIAARVDEIDRGKLQTGQRVKVHIDAVPDTEFVGQIIEISPLAKSDFSGWPIVRNFDIRMKLDKEDPRLKPGMSASARIAVDTIKDAIMIPVEASFQKSGRTVAYVVKSGGRFEERTIEILRRSNGTLAVASGLNPGERVLTKDPTLQIQEGKQ